MFFCSTLQSLLPPCSAEWIEVSAPETTGDNLTSHDFLSREIIKMHEPLNIPPISPKRYSTNKVTGAAPWGGGGRGDIQPPPPVVIMLMMMIPLLYYNFGEKTFKSGEKMCRSPPHFGLPNIISKHPIIRSAATPPPPPPHTHTGKVVYDLQEAHMYYYVPIFEKEGIFVYGRFPEKTREIFSLFFFFFWGGGVKPMVVIVIPIYIRERGVIPMVYPLF